ncbi:glycosyltransferase [Aquimarina agarivorans]|uniref:glycosyltransferase n=1 Tax=Aquimarina agarivorans TaxID=980584 RepID=UPI000248E5EA|nr:glycosyltransferase [Aquimarina agarivorans]
MLKIGVVVDNEFDHDHRVQKEIQLLLNQGHQICVLCFDFGDNYRHYSNFTVVRVKIPKKIKDLLVLLSTNFNFYEQFWVKSIAKFITNFELNAIHTHDLYMSKATHLGIKKSNKKIPLILDLHENYPAAINSYQWATKGWRKYIVQPKKWYIKEASYLKYADYLIVLSNSFKQNLISRYSFLATDAIFVNPNMPNLNSFKHFETQNLHVDYTSSLPTLFYFGVVAKRRGILSILPWMASLLKEGLRFNLLIIGPVDKADKNEFTTLINSKDLKNNITYLPWADVKYLPAYLKKTQIGLAPFEVNAQHDSGVANKLFQYMYGEIPILATPCKAQKELIETNKCGLIYKDYKSFRRNLMLLLDKAYAHELGTNGKKELQNLYKNKEDQQFLKAYELIEKSYFK